MWKLKSCPRCGGDIFVDRDQDGWYEQCLQCSYCTDLESTVEVPEKVSRGNRRRAKKIARVK